MVWLWDGDGVAVSDGVGDGVDSVPDGVGDGVVVVSDGVGDGVAVVSDGVGDGVGVGWVSPPITTVTVLSSSGLGVAVACGGV